MESALQKAFYWVFLTYSFSSTVNACPHSCQEIYKAATGPVASGEYSIYIPRLKSQITVYCEMGLNGGGYTFLRPFDLPNLIDSDIQAIFTDKKTFLLRARVTNGSQPYGVLEQLPTYSSTPLTIHLNGYIDFTSPQNLALDAPYMFYGFLPASMASVAGVTQGFQMNGQSLTFVNCDANPNSYIALFSDFKEDQPTTYGAGWTFQMTIQFVKELLPNPSRRVMPSEYFTFMEIHQGGCGTFAQTDGNPDLGDILSVNIGFR